MQQQSSWLNMHIFNNTILKKNHQMPGKISHYV